MKEPWRQRGTRLKRLRQRRGLTQQQLAAAVGVARVTVARVEIGAARPSLGLLERLARALGVKVSRLLD